MLIYDIIELFFFYSPNRYIYGLVLLLLVEFLLVRRFAKMKKTTALLMALSMAFVYINLVLPWQQWYILLPWQELLVYY